MQWSNLNSYTNQLKYWARAGGVLVDRWYTISNYYCLKWYRHISTFRMADMSWRRSKQQYTFVNTQTMSISTCIPFLFPNQQHVSSSGLFLSPTISSFNSTSLLCLVSTFYSAHKVMLSGALSCTVRNVMVVIGLLSTSHVSWQSEENKLVLTWWQISIYRQLSFVINVQVIVICGFNTIGPR